MRRRRLSGVCGVAAGALLLFARGTALAQAPPSDGGLRPVLPPASTSSQFMGAFSSAVTLIPPRETLYAEAEAMRMRLGPLHLRPRLYIGNLGYTNNFYGSTDAEADGDFTATVGGGLAVLVPVGSSIFLKGSVIPTYTWYSQNRDRSAFGGTYDASALFYISRFSFQLTGGSYRSTVNLSSEVEQPVEQSVLLGRFRGQWEIGSRTALTGDVTLQQRRYGGSGFSQEDLDTVAGLDGTDKVWSVGVRRKVGSRLLLGVSYEQGDLSFVSEGSLRDATSKGILGSAFLDEGRLQTNVYGGYREYKPKAGSTFTPYSGPSGGATLSYAFSRLLSLSVLGKSNLVSSLYADNAVYVERRAGASLGVSLRSVTLLATYELGPNEYLDETTQPDGSAVKRRDDVQTVRGSLMVPVSRYLRIGIDASQSRYTSNIPGFDRSVFQIGTTIGLGASGTIEILK